jgi:hypothetical protein
LAIIDIFLNLKPFTYFPRKLGSNIAGIYDITPHIKTKELSLPNVGPIGPHLMSYINKAIFMKNHLATNVS